MRFSPTTQEKLADEATQSIIVAGRGSWSRALVDGAPPTDPGRLADAIAERLRVLGRPAVRVRAADFLRPASLRFERGREDPDARYEAWLDEGALRREVLDPLGPGGSGRVLPSLWDAAADRATRAAYVSLPEGGVVVVDGELLLGRGLPHEVSVHLSMTPAALARRTDEAWALPAYARYDAEVDPLAVADIAARVDDPRRPARRLSAIG
ncbi:uridine kinase [Actinokineospora fastidiosa]|uniref:uridine kinase n=1 Tax=Actinokineospora fastidiosa TaxID=1816 RepID=UPI0016716EE7|nr:uridine kinase [Actinokineospora fastidiosa]